MEKRTYGVFGLMDYTINVKLGERVLKIPFTGGMASKNGVRPAVYTTSNPIIQFAIESDIRFKSGKVKIIKTIDVATPNENVNSQAKEEVKKSTSEKKKVKVPCLEDAREYLVSNCGGQASTLRCKKSIEEYAASHGIVFEGI